MRILVVQYAGDYREAYRRLEESGTETYYGHRYVLEQLSRLQSLGDVAIMCCLSPERYHERLPNGTTVIGAQMHPKRQARQVKLLMEAWDPTHLIVLGPLPQIIRWGIGSGRRVLCLMADSFSIHPLLRLAKYGRLSHLLNDPRVEWGANHGVNACRSLVQIGVDPAKVIAWDYPYIRRPEQLAPRQLSESNVRTLLYVGTVQAKKGVGDAIEAVAELKRRGLEVHLHIAGSGEVEQFRDKAKKARIADRVKFLGLLSNSEVFQQMRLADAVVVPSRHDYPEGLPLTIYEALCARTPIIASDHPMFAGHLVHKETGMVFRARQPAALAETVERLLGDAELYASLSRNTAGAWERMQNRVKWGDVLFRWARDSDADRTWLANASLQASRNR